MALNRHWINNILLLCGVEHKLACPFSFAQSFISNKKITSKYVKPLALVSHWRMLYFWLLSTTPVRLLLLAKRNQCKYCITDAVCLLQWFKSNIISRGWRKTEVRCFLHLLSKNIIKAHLQNAKSIAFKWRTGGLLNLQQQQQAFWYKACQKRVQRMWLWQCIRRYRN